MPLRQSREERPRAAAALCWRTGSARCISALNVATVCGDIDSAALAGDEMTAKRPELQGLPALRTRIPGSRSVSVLISAPESRKIARSR